MNLNEAKQILKDKGFRLLKESEGYTFRIAGGKITELLTGGKYQKTLKYDEKDAAAELGDDTLEREFMDVNDLVNAVVDDLTCLDDDKSVIENVSTGVLQHIGDDSAATLDIHISFRAEFGLRTKYKNRLTKNAHLVITGNTGAGSVGSDDLSTVLKAQLNNRNGEIKDLRSSQKFESYRGKGRLLKESSYYTISLPVVKVSVDGRDYFANGVTATGELTAGCGSRGEDEFEIDPTSVVPDVSYWTIGDSEVGETPDMVAELCDVLAGLEGWEVPDTDEYHI